tara:strand:- start:642 stop:773 length:132 start_codon:yes stop_codon:yes gene_type:complete
VQQLVPIQEHLLARQSGTSEGVLCIQALLGGVYGVGLLGPHAR